MADDIAGRIRRWEEKVVGPSAARAPERRNEFATTSGIPLPDAATQLDDMAALSAGISLDRVSASILPRAQRKLGQVSSPTFERVCGAIRAPGEDPRPSGCRKSGQSMRLRGREIRSDRHIGG